MPSGPVRRRPDRHGHARRVRPDRPVAAPAAPRGPASRGGQVEGLPEDAKQAQPVPQGRRRGRSAHRQCVRRHRPRGAAQHRGGGKSMKPVATLDDILAAEAQGWPEDLPDSTYDLIRRGAAIDPDAPALSFFLKAESLREAEVWTYRELLGRITRTANAFHALGVGKDDVVSFLLPNLPETHFTIWGGQAAGIVAAFNPLLEPAAMR